MKAEGDELDDPNEETDWGALNELIETIEDARVEEAEEDARVEEVEEDYTCDLLVLLLLSPHPHTGNRSRRSRRNPFHCTEHDWAN